MLSKGYFKNGIINKNNFLKINGLSTTIVSSRTSIATTGRGVVVNGVKRSDKKIMLNNIEKRMISSGSKHGNSHGHHNGMLHFYYISFWF